MTRMRDIAKYVAVQILRGYKWAISPLFPPACRYVPTCSEYAMEAIERYGVLRGGVMAVWRLLRCHPFAHGGYDPAVKATGTSAARAAVEEEGIIAALKRCATQNLWHLRFAPPKSVSAPRDI